MNDKGKPPTHLNALLNGGPILDDKILDLRERVRSLLEEIADDRPSVSFAIRYPNTLVTRGDHIYELNIDLKISARPARVHPPGPRQTAMFGDRPDDD